MSNGVNSSSNGLQSQTISTSKNWTEKMVQQWNCIALLYAAIFPSKVARLAVLAEIPIRNSNFIGTAWDCSEWR